MRGISSISSLAFVRIRLRVDCTSIISFMVFEPCPLLDLVQTQDHAHKPACLVQVSRSSIFCSYWRTNLTVVGLRERLDHPHLLVLADSSSIDTCPSKFSTHRCQTGLISELEWLRWSSTFGGRPNTTHMSFWICSTSCCAHYHHLVQSIKLSSFCADIDNRVSVAWLLLLGL